MQSIKCVSSDPDPCAPFPCMCRVKPIPDVVHRLRYKECVNGEVLFPWPNRLYFLFHSGDICKNRRVGMIRTHNGE